MSFGDSITSAFRQYATFSGRARRSEYWWFFLFTFLVSLVAALVDAVLGTDDLGGSGWGLIEVLAFLPLFLPGLAVGARRLHDIDRTAWWLLIGLIPVVGVIVLLVFFVFDSTPGPNQYGPSPKHPLPPPAAEPGYPLQ
jgi:uncharacterized membrane protein YhaH (DUF805 family)